MLAMGMESSPTQWPYGWLALGDGLDLAELLGLLGDRAAGLACCLLCKLDRAS